MSSTAQNRYKGPVRETKFLLFEQFPLSDVLGKGPYEAWGKDECTMVLDESYKFACEVLGPLNATGDREGCHLESGRVITPTGFKDAWKRQYEAGWKSLASSPEYDGQNAPAMLTCAVEEFLCGANPAFNMYGGLAHGAGPSIWRPGGDDPDIGTGRRHGFHPPGPGHSLEPGEDATARASITSAASNSSAM